MTERADTRITNKEIAVDVAYAQKPFIDLGIMARQLGQPKLAGDIEFTGEFEAARIERIANTLGSIQRKEMEDAAFSKLCRETEVDVLTATDFKITDDFEGIDAWGRLYELVHEEESELPLKFVQYGQSKYALVGDVATAAKQIHDDSILENIMVKLAEVLEATSGARVMDYDKAPVPADPAQWPEARSFRRLYGQNPHFQSRLVMALLGFKTDLMEWVSDSEVATDAIDVVIKAFIAEHPEFIEDGFTPDNDTGMGVYRLDKRLISLLREAGVEVEDLE